jgi:hypothetical protein
MSMEDLAPISDPTMCVRHPFDLTFEGVNNERSNCSNLCSLVILLRASCYLAQDFRPTPFMRASRYLRVIQIGRRLKPTMSKSWERVKGYEVLCRTPNRRPVAHV